MVGRGMGPPSLDGSATIMQIFWCKCSKSCPTFIIVCDEALYVVGRYPSVAMCTAFLCPVMPFMSANRFPHRPQEECPTLRWHGVCQDWTCIWTSFHSLHMEHHFHYRRTFQCLKTLRFTQVPVLVVFLSRYSSHYKADKKSLCQGALRTSVLDGPAAALHVTVQDLDVSAAPSSRVWKHSGSLKSLSWW